jgi:hypothetical protein
MLTDWMAAFSLRPYTVVDARSAKLLNFYAISMSR